MSLIDTLLAAPGVLCHGLDHRSPVIDGHPLPVCWRCLGLNGGYLLGWLAAVSGRFGWRPPQVRELVWLVPALLPLMIDAWANRLGLWQTAGTVRAVTGLLAGFALVRCLSGLIAVDGGFLRQRVGLTVLLAGMVAGATILLGSDPELWRHRLLALLILIGWSMTLAALAATGRRVAFQLAGRQGDCS